MPSAVLEAAAEVEEGLDLDAKAIQSRHLHNTQADASKAPR